MTRKLVILLSFVAATALATGCKDEKPTPQPFDPSKAGYGSAQQQYRTAPSGAQSKSAE